MEKIRFCHWDKTKLNMRYYRVPEDEPSCEKCVEYYRAEEVDTDASAYRDKVRRMVTAARLVIKISDRKHDAWDELKQAIAEAEDGDAIQEEKK